MDFCDCTSPNYPGSPRICAMHTAHCGCTAPSYPGSPRICDLHASFRPSSPVYDPTSPTYSPNSPAYTPDSPGPMTPSYEDYLREEREKLKKENMESKFVRAISSAEKAFCPFLTVFDLANLTASMEALSTSRFDALDTARAVGKKCLRDRRKSEMKLGVKHARAMSILKDAQFKHESLLRRDFEAKHISIRRHHKIIESIREDHAYELAELNDDKRDMKNKIRRKDAQIESLRRKVAQLKRALYAE